MGAVSFNLQGASAPRKVVPMTASFSSLRADWKAAGMPVEHPYFDAATTAPVGFVEPLALSLTGAQREYMESTAVARAAQSAANVGALTGCKVVL